MKAKAVAEQADYNWAILKHVFHQVFGKLDHSANGIRNDYGDGQARLCFPTVYGWIADYMEACSFHSVISSACCLCEVPKNNVGQFEEVARPARDFRLYKRRLNEHDPTMELVDG